MIIVKQKFNKFLLILIFFASLLIKVASFSNDMKLESYNKKIILRPIYRSCAATSHGQSSKIAFLANKFSHEKNIKDYF